MPEQDTHEVLKRSIRRWKRVAIISWGAFALAIAFGAGGVLTMQREAARTVAESERAARRTEEARQRAETDAAQLAVVSRDNQRMLYLIQAGHVQATRHAAPKSSVDWLQEASKP